MNDRELGLYEKFHVARLNDETGKHQECDYFVLDLVHDRHARAALISYALSCENEFPVLSRDLLERCGFGSGDVAETFGN